MHAQRDPSGATRLASRKHGWLIDEEYCADNDDAVVPRSLTRGEALAMSVEGSAFDQVAAWSLYIASLFVLP